MEKHAIRSTLRLRVGLLSYLFPSFAASRFDLEAPFSLEEACYRLEKLERVRGSKEIPKGLSLFDATPDRPTGRSSTTIPVQPIEVRLAPLDADTYRYQVTLDEDRFRVVVRGYLKRWDTGSTMVNGRVWFDVHYFGLLVQSLVFTAAGMALLFFLAYGINFSPRSSLQVLNSVIAQFLNPSNRTLTMIRVWLLVMAVIWFNAVVLHVHTRRNQLMTRLEDMLLYPYLGR